MKYSTAELEMAETHVAEGERHVARQKEIVADLQSAGHPSDLAEQLLVQFEETLATHILHRDRILAEMGSR